MPFEAYGPWAVGMYRVGVHYRALNRSLGHAVIRFKRWTELTRGGLVTFDVVDAAVWHDPTIDPALQPDPSFDGARQTLSMTWLSFDEDWRVIGRVESPPQTGFYTAITPLSQLAPGWYHGYDAQRVKWFFGIVVMDPVALVVRVNPDGDVTAGPGAGKHFTWEQFWQQYRISGGVNADYFRRKGATDEE